MESVLKAGAPYLQVFLRAISDLGSPGAASPLRTRKNIKMLQVSEGGTVPKVSQEREDSREGSRSL